MDGGLRAARGPGMTVIVLSAFFCLASTCAHARLDLTRASVERLDNGLTLIMLEDRTLPVVSIQTVYRTGAKDDPAGRLGLAHFFEHMAFRGSKNFPGTGLVSEIYAAGGEWHGYTWIDLTTYFATTPGADLDLLLDIEADRMARLDLRPEEVEAERGAVLAEMNGYADDPDATLFDALMAAHYLTHPYRNNTIGYAADINAIRHEDLVAFYARRYAPGNAIIALVGDFERQAARAAVVKRFGGLKKPAAPQDPLTAEMPRTGERRIRLSLPSDEKLFKIAYPAPAASSPDFAPFLLLQALVGDSGGVNFNQNDWGVPVGDASLLAGAAENVRTFIIPTAEPYAFVVSGSAGEKNDESKIEKRIQKTFEQLARDEVPSKALADAREEVRAALAFDVDTTEEAAHQLAYFAGIGALDQLMTLEADVLSATAQDIAHIAATYLADDQRTIAWLSPGAPPPQEPATAVAPAKPRSGAPADTAPMPAPTALGDGVFFQYAPLSPTIAVKAVIGGRHACDLCIADDPAFGLTSISSVTTAERAADAFANVAASSRAAEPLTAVPFSEDPLTRLEETFAGFARPNNADAAAMLVAVSGDLDAERAHTLAAPLSGSGGPPAGARFAAPAGDINILIDRPFAQGAVGYAATAPAANEKAALATRIALYILSHGYEGRLGKEAIARRGLAYYIDARYRAGTAGGLVTLAASVDRDKISAFREALKGEVARLIAEPPTEAEIAEARRHLLGRKISAAQSNSEIVDALLVDALALGAPESVAAFKARLETIGRDDVLNATATLARGAVVTVRVGGVE